MGVTVTTEARLAYAHLGSKLSCFADNLVTILNSGHGTATCENGMSDQHVQVNFSDLHPEVKR